MLFLAYFSGRDLYEYLKSNRPANETVLNQRRNFFGTLTVLNRENDDPEEAVRKLIHGRITHGVQFLDPTLREYPTSYYSRESGIGYTVGYYHASKKIDGVRLGTVGLGTGTMAVFVRDKEDPNAKGKNDSIHFYEINPEVIDITEPGKYFTYLQDAKKRGGDYKITLGDARLSLEKEVKDGDFQKFHVLVLDAFSGDAIPMHLLTEEAFETYLKHMATGNEGKGGAEADGEAGAIAVHITNRYLDLEPIVLGLAERFKLGHVLIVNGNGGEAMYSSDWLILSKNKDLIKELSQYENPETEPKKPILWTDGKSNLFDVLK